MNIETIYNDLHEEVKKLDETEKGRKRKEFFSEYDELSSKLRTEHAEICTLRKQGDFDKAAEKTLAIAQLEAKERVMHPTYVEYCSTPVYDMADLIDISNDLVLVLQKKLRELEQEQEKLLREALELQRKKVRYTEDAKKCRNELIKLSEVTDIRDKLKFGRIPEQVTGIKAMLSKLELF